MTEYSVSHQVLKELYHEVSFASGPFPPLSFIILTNPVNLPDLPTALVLPGAGGWTAEAGGAKVVGR